MHKPPEEDGKPKIPQRRIALLELAKNMGYSRNKIAIYLNTSPDQIQSLSSLGSNTLGLYDDVLAEVLDRWLKFVVVQGNDLEDFVADVEDDKEKAPDAIPVSEKKAPAERRADLLEKAKMLGYSKTSIAQWLNTSSQNISNLCLREAPRSPVADKLDRWLNFVVVEGNDPKDFVLDIQDEEKEIMAGVAKVLKQAASFSNQPYLSTKEKVSLMQAHVSTAQRMLNSMAGKGELDASKTKS